MSAFGAPHAADKLDKGVRFDSPQVLDLSAWSAKPVGAVVPVTALAASEVEQFHNAILADEQNQWLRFSDDVYACKESKACSQQQETRLIASENAGVQRRGKHLTITPAREATIVFSDWATPEMRSADGDEESHWYLGHLAGNGYHRVEVQFGHDSPGSFLINPASGKTAFVHNGSDVVESSPNGLYLVTFNADNLPLSIRVAVLDASGPGLELFCAASKADQSIAPAFGGWRDAKTFDVTLESRGMDDKPKHRAAMRFMRARTGWTIAASDKTLLESIGFVCKENK